MGWANQMFSLNPTFALLQKIAAYGAITNCVISCSFQVSVGPSYIVSIHALSHVNLETGRESHCPSINYTLQQTLLEKHMDIPVQFSSNYEISGSKGGKLWVFREILANALGLFTHREYPYRSIGTPQRVTRLSYHATLYCATHTLMLSDVKCMENKPMEQ